MALTRPRALPPCLSINSETRDTGNLPPAGTRARQAWRSGHRGGIVVCGGDALSGILGRHPRDAGSSALSVCDTQSICRPRLISPVGCEFSNWGGRDGRSNHERVVSSVE